MAPKKPTRKKPAGKVRAREPLGRERVMETAARLADESGIDGLSMRNLALALGVEAMSLYHHVKNKEEILLGITDRVAGEIHVPVIGADWRSEIRARAISAHTVLMRHRWATRLFVSQPNVGPNMLRYVDSTLGCLVAAGFDYPMADHAWQVIDGHVYGFTLQKLNFPFQPDEYAEVARHYVTTNPTDQYPHLYELARWVMERRHSGVQDFTFGLDMLLDGLEKVRRP